MTWAIVVLIQTQIALVNIIVSDVSSGVAFIIARSCDDKVHFVLLLHQGWSYLKKYV